MKCGYYDIRALQIDYKNGGGTRVLRKMSSLAYYKHILDLPIEKVREMYQILCANCNIVKKEENRENYIWKNVLKSP